MAGNVTGSIGADNVNLNNAATESTLAALLKIAQTDSQNLIAIAKKVFPDIKLKEFEEELNKGTEAQAENTQALIDETAAIKKKDEYHNRNIAILKQLDLGMTQLMNGTAQVSDVFNAFRDMPGVIGIVATGLGRLAEIQQKNFEAYQALTDVGVGFGGSLTELRQGAANTYLTLEQFQNVIKNNSQMLAMLGGTADEGARNFVALSSALIKSDTGAHLMDLGYTTEQVNQGMASYLTMSGGRTAKELQNTDAIVKGSAEYMEQLDGLARVTGQSRDEQEKAMKAQAASAAWQAKLQGMSEDEKKKAVAGLANALATGGKGAADAFQSKVMGIPPLSKEAQLFTATMGSANSAIMQSASNVTDSTKTMADMNESFFQAANGIQVDISQYGEEQKAALIAQGGPLGQAIQEAQMHANKFGQQTDEDRRKAMARQALENTQAQQMQQAMTGLKELGAALWGAFSPVIAVVTFLFGVVGMLAKGLAKVIEFFGPFSTAILMAGAGVAAWWMWSAKQWALEKAKTAGGGLMGAAGGLMGGKKGGGGGPMDALGGIGGGVGGALEGLAKGLTAFANPAILLGATIFGASIGIIIGTVGAGIAAAMALIGLSMPIFAEGLDKLAKIDASNLGSLALGLGELGLGLMTWGPFALFGIPAGMALNSLADGVTKLAGVDAAKLGEVANALQKVKDATPSAGEILRIGIASMVSKAVGPSEGAAAAPTSNTSSKDAGNNVGDELKRLNSMTEEMLKVMKENVEYMKRNVSATKSLSGDLLKF